MSPIILLPGPEKSAWVIWDGYTILNKGLQSNAEFLGVVTSSDQCYHLVCEMIACYGMAVGAEVFETCVWIGRFWQAWLGPFHRVKRLEVKMHLCHDSRAKDPHIRQALIDRLGAPGTARNPGPTHGVKDDIWAALAVAVAFHDKLTEGAPKPWQWLN